MLSTSSKKIAKHSRQLLLKRLLIWTRCYNIWVYSIIQLFIIIIIIIIIIIVMYFI